MRWSGFGRSVAFAALAGAAWPAFALATAPLVGARVALALYLVAATGAYVAGIAATAASGVAAALLAVALATTFAGVAGTARGAALGAALALGLVRSGVLHRTHPAWAFAIEAALLGGGLAVAKLLFAPGALGPALALWGFFLVQSVFFAIGGARLRGADRAPCDRFESARRRTLALLDEEA